MSKSQRGKKVSKLKLKQRYFNCFGWINDDGNWEIECAFGCGDLLTWETATLDRYPIMGMHGGKYEWGNIRLACSGCNSRNRNKNESQPPNRQQRFKAKRERKARNKALRKLVEIRTVEGKRSMNGEIKMDLK